MLQTLLVALLVGFALQQMGRTGAPVLRGVAHIQRVVFRVLAMIMWAAPIGAFGAIAAVVGETGADALKSLALLMVAFYITCFLFVIVVLGGLLKLATGVNLFSLLRYLAREYLLIVSTSSSESALPRLIAKMEHAGIDKPTVGVVVPTGYSFNLDGTAIYLTMASLFIAEAMGAPLSIGEQISLLLFMMVASKGAAGVTGAGMATLAGGLSSHRPELVDGVGLIVGIDRFMSEARAVTNFSGNAVATVLIGHWTGGLDRIKLDSVLAGDDPFDETTMLDHDEEITPEELAEERGRAPAARAGTRRELAHSKTQNSLPSGSASVTQRGISHSRVAPWASRSASLTAYVPVDPVLHRLGLGHRHEVEGQHLVGGRVLEGPPGPLLPAAGLDPEDPAPPGARRLRVGAVDDDAVQLERRRVIAQEGAELTTFGVLHDRPLETALLGGQLHAGTPRDELVDGLGVDVEVDAVLDRLRLGHLAHGDRLVFVLADHVAQAPRVGSEVGADGLGPEASESVVAVGVHAELEKRRDGHVVTLGGATDRRPGAGPRCLDAPVATSCLGRGACSTSSRPRNAVVPHALLLA